jgi:hypothetical protein
MYTIESNPLSSTSPIEGGNALFGKNFLHLSAKRLGLENSCQMADGFGPELQEDNLRDQIGTAFSAIPLRVICINSLLLNQTELT